MKPSATTTLLSVGIVAVVVAVVVVVLTGAL